MNIDELTIGEAKKLAEMFGNQVNDGNKGIVCGIGEKVIVRTYSAGVWFGTLREKAGNEVILANARRMWRWFANDGICLSSCAEDGINQDKSKICRPVGSVWLKAIEIIPCSPKSITSIEEAKNAVPE